MSRGQIVRWMLEEVGEPYEPHILDYDIEMKAEPICAINPMGRCRRSSTRQDRDRSARRSAATSPTPFPPPGSARRADRGRRLLSLAVLRRGADRGRRSATRPMGSSRRPKGRPMFGYGSYELAVKTLERAIWRAATISAGDRFTAADVYVGSQVASCSQFGIARAAPAFIDYVARLTERAGLCARQGDRRQADRGDASRNRQPEGATMDDDLRQQAIELYDRFTHEGMERRDFFAAMTRFAGGAAAANLLIGSIAASPAAAAIVAGRRQAPATAHDDARRGTPYKAYVAEREPRAAKRGTVHRRPRKSRAQRAYRDVARRLALAGFHAVAPDFLSPSGGTPAKRGCRARGDRQARPGRVDRRRGGDARRACARAAAATARSAWSASAGAAPTSTGSRSRRATSLTPAWSITAPRPTPAEAARVTAPLLIQLAGLDTRVNNSAFPWVAALRAAGKPVDIPLYDGVNHAFNNDTSAERYRQGRGRPGVEADAAPSSASIVA